MDKSVLRLVHFTDPHLYGSETESLRGIATLPALTATLALAQARDWPPDAVLVTGDIVQDDPAGSSWLPGRQRTGIPRELNRRLKCA